MPGLSFTVPEFARYHLGFIAALERLSVIFKNPATEAKLQLFYFAPKDPFGELF